MHLRKELQNIPVEDVRARAGRPPDVLTMFMNIIFVFSYLKNPQIIRFEYISEYNYKIFL